MRRTPQEEPMIIATVLPSSLLGSMGSGSGLIGAGGSISLPSFGSIPLSSNESSYYADL